MFTGVFAIGNACIFMAATPIWPVQKPSEAVLSHMVFWCDDPAAALAKIDYHCRNQLVFHGRRT
jgi:hypothetical protein